MKIESRARKRGIVLVTVLFLTMLISMFIGAAVLVGPRTLGLAGSQDGELTANAAAESGMQYAIMRIRENPDWRADGNGIVLSTPDFTVVENSGYIWGHMTSSNGAASMFRIRFNYENGDDGGDNLSDSAGPRIETPYVSINNLSNSDSTVVPRADAAAQSSVVDPTVGDYVVPPHGLSLIVEGISGPGVRNFDPNNPNPSGFITSKILEGTFTVDNFGDDTTDAVAMSNSDLIAVLEDGEEFSVTAKGGGTPTVRSRGQMEVSQQDGADGKYESQGTVYTQNGTLDADYDNGKVTVETESATDPFYELTWDELKTADPSGDRLPAGTYVWWDDNTLHYYEMDYDAYSQWIKNPANTDNAGQVIFANGSYAGGFTPPSSLEITPGKMQLTGDLYIEPVTDAAGTGQTSDFTMIPREGAPEDPTPAGGGPTVAGPALAQYLASNPAALQTFFNGRTGDGSPIGGQGGTQGWNSGPATGIYADITWEADGSAVYFDTLDYSSLENALTDAFADGYVAQTELDQAAAQYGLTGAEGDLNLGTGDSTTAEDLDFEFKPGAGESATLSGDGDIRIGAQMKGKGASITSGGELTVVGAGADLAANPNAEEGVNMYARGDITLSTLKEKNNGDFEFKDIKLKGLVYTWGDFNAKLGSDDDSIKRGKFKLDGTLVAYGGDPANGKPTTTAKGRVNINAKKVDLKFDPAYLLGLMKTLPSDIVFRRASWTVYR